MSSGVRRWAQLFVVAVAWVELAAVQPAAADDNHYQGLLVGDRAAGMGGAFTAISDDSSGAYYNPAGLAEAPHSSVSLSSAVYGFVSQSYEIAQVDFTSDNRGFASYPTTAAWIQRVRAGAEDGAGRIQLALSLFSPQSNVTRQRLAYQMTPSTVDNLTVYPEVLSSEVAEDDTLWVGLSGAWKIWRRLAVGATLFTTIRTGLYQFHTVTLLRGMDAQSGEEVDRLALSNRIGLELSHLAMLGLVGVVLSPTDHLRLGLAFRTPSLELRGRASAESFETSQQEDKSFAVTTDNVDGITLRDRTPWKATLGLAYLVPQRWGASLDFSLYGPVGEYAMLKHSDEPELQNLFRMKKKLVWQLNAGLEYYPRPFLPLRLGFFTDRSSLDPLQDCSSGQCQEVSHLFTDGIDFYGVTGSIGYELERVALNIGCSYSFGSRQTVEQGTTLDTRRSYLFIVMGGAFRF